MIFLRIAFKSNLFSKGWKGEEDQLDIEFSNKIIENNLDRGGSRILW